MLPENYRLIFVACVKIDEIKKTNENLNRKKIDVFL